MYSSNLTPRFVFTVLRVTIIITIVVGFLTVLPTVTKSTETAIQQLDRSAPNSCRINYSCGHFQDLGTGLFGKVGSVTIHSQINTNFDSHTYFGIRLYDATTHTYYGGEYYATSPVFLDDSLWLGDISLAISTTSQDYTFKIPEQPILNPAHNYLIDIVFQSQLDGRTFTIFGSNNPESYPKGAWQSDNPNDIQDIYFIVELLGPKPPTDKDTDGDCLTDTQEWLFGTNPENIDTDGDGLFDEWEVYGIDHENSCGDLGLFLPGLGANPRHRDIFLEVDWMDCAIEEGDCAEGDNHTHILKEDAKNRVVEAFRNAPVQNPDGIPGITLHIDVSNAVQHETSISFAPFGFGIVESDFDEIKRHNFDENRKKAFRYGLFAHSLSFLGIEKRNSGIAERPGNDFMVTLGNFTDGVGSIWEQAGTLMHELGHTFGLGHGGNDSVQNKPNYLSVMNYYFQMRGITDLSGETRFDYSPSLSPVLDEKHLDENNNIQSNHISYFFCPDQEAPTPFIGNKPTDWDCNGVFEQDTKANINNDQNFFGFPSYDELVGMNDWASLFYNFREAIDFADGVHENITDPTEELDLETIERFALDHRPLQIKIDIRPDSDENPLNLKSSGVIPVAILGSEDFDVSYVLIQSVRFFGSSEIEKSSFEDVNNDGFIDLLLHYRIQSLQNITADSTFGSITGETGNKIIFFGEDKIKIAPPK